MLQNVFSSLDVKIKEDFAIKKMGKVIKTKLLSFNETTLGDKTKTLQSLTLSL